MGGPLRYITHTGSFEKKSDFNTQVILVKVIEEPRTLCTTKAEFIGGNVNQA